MNREQLCIALGYGDCGKRALDKKRKPKKKKVKGFDVDSYIKTLPFPNQITHIDLSNQGIEELKAETFQPLKNLRSLNLSGNRLTSLPPNIFRYNTKLNALNLSGNRLIPFPHNILDYNQLETLIDKQKNGKPLREI